MTKVAETAIVTEAEAEAEIGRGRRQERKRRIATRNAIARKIVTGTGAGTVSARANLVDLRPLATPPKASLQLPIQLPLLKVKSLLRGEKNCGLGHHSSRLAHRTLHLIAFCSLCLYVLYVGVTLAAGRRPGCCPGLVVCSQRNATAVITCFTRETNPSQQYRNIAR